MPILRSAVVVAALLLASEAQAYTTAFAFDGTLDAPTSGLASRIPAGTPISGVFLINELEYPEPTWDPGLTAYPQALNGFARVGNDLIRFSHGDGVLVTYPDNNTAYLTADHAYQHDLTETQPPAGYGLNWLEVDIRYAPGYSWGTPLRDVLGGQLGPRSSAAIYLDYGSESITGTITSITPTSPSVMSTVPEPSGVLTVGTALGALFVRRRMLRG